MECKLSMESARTLDRIMGHPTIRTIVLSTLESVTLQTRLENSILCTNIVLTKDFFAELKIKSSMTVEFPKVRLCYPEMEFLEIRLDNYFVEFYWKFKSHTLTRTLCINYAELKGIDFEYQESFELDATLLQEVVRQLSGDEIMFSFDDKIVFYNVASPEGTRLEIKNNTRIKNAKFSVLRKCVRAATESPFEKYDLLIDRDERRLNICMSSDGIMVSHLASVYIG